MEYWAAKPHTPAMDRADYEQDYYLWSREQANALRAAARAGANLPIDWENVAEEIESLGRSDRREIASRLGTIIEHLLKLQSSTAIEPRAGWEATVSRARVAVSRLLDESPSLRREVSAMMQVEMAQERRFVARELAARGERLADLPDYTEDQVMGDWLP